MSTSGLLRTAPFRAVVADDEVRPGAVVGLGWIAPSHDAIVEIVRDVQDGRGRRGVKSDDCREIEFPAIHGVHGRREGDQGVAGVRVIAARLPDYARRKLIENHLCRKQGNGKIQARD